MQSSDVRPNDTQQEYSKLIQEENTKSSCPICFKECANLNELNKHLDKDHNFGNENSNGDHVKKHQNKKKSSGIRTSHHEVYNEGMSKCAYCRKKLTKSNGVSNCYHCGKLYCRSHLLWQMKLDKRARYDPQHGKFYPCCFKCTSSRPGYNDYGLTVSKTSEFSRLRSSKMEDKQLRSLQLETRLLKLIDGYISISRKYGNNLFSTVVRNSELSKYERSIVHWKDDSNVHTCNICTSEFGLVRLSRKHHCRLCGNIVCDTDGYEEEVINTRRRKTTMKKCSYQIKLRNLKSSTDDLHYNSQLRPDEEYIAELQVRLCSTCIDNLLLKRKFKRDLTKPMPPLLSRYETLHNIADVIRTILPPFQDALQKIDNERTKKVSDEKELADLSKLRVKLLRSFANYNSVNKQLCSIKPSNFSEERVKNSLLVESSYFINENILPLRSLPAVLSGEDYVMSKSEPEVKKLSELMSSDLSIKEIKQGREELMVLEEQIFQIESLVETAKRQRKFDEVATLTTNLNELNQRATELREKLGQEGF
ncbi:Rabenosyn Rab binding domain [Nakaseomyces glabratus]|nr:Rabenosyn Rab binding domain [Nakaseomyces glabratus]KAH7592520.1 Rabenosyn Rab binding domain [Nakaseomyces glabratus]KAH7610365.1 Rabenosyn Rab binding domain [Nakaseomyces glabratus]